MTDDPYGNALERARARLDAGDDLDAVLADMRARGMSEIPGIRAVRDLLGVDLGKAKSMVRFSRAFADHREVNEGLHESLVGALREVNEIETHARDQAAETADPVRELGDLRAALTITLRMLRREQGPGGLTVLSVPTDGEIVAEVGRLRQVADAAEGVHDAGDQR